MRIIAKEEKSKTNFSIFQIIENGTETETEYYNKTDSSEYIKNDLSNAYNVKKDDITIIRL